MFIGEDLVFNPRSDLKQDELEVIWIEIILPKTVPIVVGVCYRPPTQADLYTLFEQSSLNMIE